MHEPNRRPDLIEVLDIYKWIVIAAVIVSWLTAFNVINQHNNFVRTRAAHPVSP